MKDRLSKLLPEPNTPATWMAVRALKKFHRPPFWLVGVFLAAVVASWIPLVMIADGRVRKSDQPRVHLVQDMDNQAKYKSQMVNPIFADGRSDRPIPAGTVSRGAYVADGSYALGFIRTGGTDAEPQVDFLDEFPAEVTVDKAFVARGQNRYNIYCYVCHGYDGRGNGRVHQWASEIAQDPRWIPPSNLLSETVVNRPDGHLYNTVNNGIRNMAGYGAQIPVKDRWAIVAYIRSLQLAQNAPPDALDPAERARLRDLPND